MRNIDLSGGSGNGLTPEQELELSKIPAIEGLTNEMASLSMWYGIQWNSTIANPVVARIGSLVLHQQQPIQSRMRRCILSDQGSVVAYLDDNDSSLTESGDQADLTGATGQIMVEIPSYYRKFENEGNAFRCKLSEYPLPGFHLVPKMYRSAYEATTDRTTGTIKLASVVNLTAPYRGGNNNAAYDGTYRTFLGRPATAISLTNYRNYARNRGVAGKSGKGWNCDVYEVQKNCYWLYCVEYANLNSQAAYNAEPDVNGYRQGGLGSGPTTIDGTKWNAYNGYYPFIPCGITNSLGNKTGVVAYTMPDEYNPGVATNISAVSYRGIENPFGHIWSWTDGCKCRIQSEAAGGMSEFYTCDDPANFQDSSYDNYVLKGLLSRKEGYVKTMIVGEQGENMPTVVGGSSTTYFSDNFYTNIPSSGEAMRGVLFGGPANYGASAGLSISHTNYTASITNASLGSRLCFIP